LALKRELGLTDAVLLVVGNVVGAGIFTTSGFLAGEVPQPLWFVGIWVLGGLLTLCGALTYAELAGMFPRTGGDYQFLKEAYGTWAGFLLGWVNFWIIIPGSIAALSLALVGYVKPFIPSGGMAAQGGLPLLVIAVLAVVNYRGIRWGGTTQNFFTLGTLMLLGAFVLGGLVWGNGDWGHFAAPARAPSLTTALFGPAMIAVIFTYSGWFASAYVGEEVRDPERNVPRSLIGGTLIVSVFYTLMNVVYLYAIPLAEMKGAVNVGQMAAGRLFPPIFSLAVSLAIILAIVSSINATLLAGARIFYAMAEDRIFWGWLKQLHPRFQTPHRAIVSQALLAGILVLLGTFDQLLSYVVLIMLLASIATGAAQPILRRRRPGSQRPYRTWGAPLVPLVFVAAYLWIAWQITWGKPATSLLGLLIALSGLPFYFFWAGKKKQANP
jgi:APA family basic amino acid/polyamine antiporter